MPIWQRNHAGGDVSTRVVQVTDTLFHAEAVGIGERVATLDDRHRATLDLAQARADEMARRHFGHTCQPHLCDDWHAVTGAITHGAAFPLPAHPEAADPAGSLLIVKRGRTAWADFLWRRLGSVGERVDCRWDRRFADRRRQTAPVAPDRRVRDRRGPEPAAWPSLHFVLVPSIESGPGPS